MEQMKMCLQQIRYSDNRIFLQVVSSTENLFQSYDTQPRFFDIIGSIIAVIDQIVKQVQASLDNMQQQAGQTIANIAQQIQNFFEESAEAIQKFYNETQAEIESLIGDKILPCLEGKQQKIQGIKNQTILDIQKCNNESQSQLDQLDQDLEVYTNNTNEQIDGIRKSLRLCIEEPDFGEKIKCAVDASRVISNNVGQILENIGNATQLFISRGTAIGRDHRNCTSNARETGKNQTIAVINEIRNCLASNTSSSG